MDKFERLPRLPLILSKRRDGTACPTEGGATEFVNSLANLAQDYSGSVT